MVLVRTYVGVWMRENFLKHNQQVATAPASLAMNHSTERTFQPDVHDFKVEMIDSSLSQNDNEVVQEPTPVEETKHEISDDRTSDSDAVKVMAQIFSCRS